MRIPSSSVPVLVFTALTLGCHSGPSADDFEGVFLVVSGPISVGAQADVQVVNNSDAPVTVGWLPCYLRTDRREGNRWEEIPKEIGSCILPGYTIESGHSIPFKFGAPVTAGTFRLRTVVGGDSVFSAPFLVR